MTLTLAYEMVTRPKPGRTRRTFTPEEDATIRDMCAAGASYSEISRVLDRSEAVIGKKVRALGIQKVAAPRRPRQNTFTPEEDAALITMCAEGASYSQMARVFGCSRHRVQLRIDDLGIAKVPTPPGPAAAHAVSVGMAMAIERAQSCASYCQQCRILLSHAPAGRDGKCGYCVAEVTP